MRQKRCNCIMPGSIRMVVLHGKAGLACLLLLVLSGLVTACQTIEATGERQLSLIGEQQEVSIGRESDKDIVKTMGLYEDENLQEYIQQLGGKIAATTERPDLPWTFRVVDDDAVNAFALPGGYIYLTRGILAHFENQAQLAGVLGHEIAHVTAKHSVVRMSKAMVTQLGLGVAMVVVPELQELAPLASQGMQLLFLKFSRDDETESDMLGVRYMRNVNEDPRELIEVMEMLGRISEAREEGMVPEWASTHPYPENRIQDIAARIDELETQDYRPVERESYLQRLDTMVYGKDPRQGIVRESMFYHPDMEFAYAFPDGWKIVNQRSAVVGVSPAKDAVIQMSVVTADSPQQALQTLFRQEGVQGRNARKVTIHGNPAATGVFLAQTQQGTIQGRATFIRYGDRLFQIVGYCSEKSWGEYARLIERSMFSFDRLTDSRLLNVQPLRIDIVRVGSRTTLQELHERRGVPIPVEELARLNQLEAGATLERGQLVKMVEGELP
ncbi:MAG: M48 family metalloprotease [Desulfohalobiaceae bacterium]